MVMVIEVHWILPPLSRQARGSASPATSKAVHFRAEAYIRALARQAANMMISDDSTFPGTFLVPHVTFSRAVFIFNLKANTRVFCLAGSWDFMACMVLVGLGGWGE